MYLQSFVGPWPLLQFRNLFYAEGRTPWTSDHPVSRPLHTHRTTQTQNKCTQTPMPWVGFEPMILAFEWAKTVHASDRAATVIGNVQTSKPKSFTWDFVFSVSVNIMVIIDAEVPPKFWYQFTKIYGVKSQNIVVWKLIPVCILWRVWVLDHFWQPNVACCATEDAVQIGKWVYYNLHQS
jgi:hypothetical protein